MNPWKKKADPSLELTAGVFSFHLGMAKEMHATEICGKIHHFSTYILHSLELTAGLPLKNSAWKMNFRLGPGLFSGRVF